MSQLKQNWIHGVHHDGSPLYVSNNLPATGETIEIRLRVPSHAPLQSVFLRTTPDGERHFEKMRLAEQQTIYNIWAVEMTVSMPYNPYHFRLMTDHGAYYYTAVGINRAEKPEWYDFKIVADYQAPRWVQETIFYQIFPDRFYNGDPSLTVPEGAWTQQGFTTTRAEWGTPPQPWKEKGNLDFYGGDLVGIREKLDYLEDLGVNGIYMTPIFLSHSNHRYDILDFDVVDPYLGGNQALADLRAAMDAKNMRLMLDVTPNHISWHHNWFTTAKDHPGAETEDHFTFYDNANKFYEMWLGTPSLVKLNYKSGTVRDKIYRDQNSVLRRWLAEPYRIDGWRLDVQNMLARQREIQLHHEVGRELRQAVKSDNPDVYLIGEHWYDGTRHLQGDELDAVMNYQGFNFPLRRWISGYETGAEYHVGSPDYDFNRMPTEAMAEQMQTYLAAIPWVIAAQQFNQLGSHDTIRFLTAVKGDTGKMKLATAMLMTYVGVPCVYYGDEIGLMGRGDPENRGTMPWDDADWDVDLRAFHQKLMHLRRQSPALQQGGYQLLAAQDDVFAFARQSAEQRLVVIGYAGDDASQEVTIPVWQAGIADETPLTDLLSDASFGVQNGVVVLPELAPSQVMILEG